MSPWLSALRNTRNHMPNMMPPRIAAATTIAMTRRMSFFREGLRGANLVGGMVWVGAGV